MCRDPFARDTQGALGQPYTKSRYYHLYLNGHYWGIYYSEERAEAEFGASYMGGDADEYDAVKCGNHIGNFVTEATDGTLAGLADALGQDARDPHHRREQREVFRDPGPQRRWHAQPALPGVARCRQPDR